MMAEQIAHSDAVGRDGLITEAMDEWKIPGLAVAVLQNGEVALVRAYAMSKPACRSYKR